ncbi:MAG TPA: 2-alkenal reductase [Rhodocyclaceae bacterium]|nr:MAG: 2-alkenal reductase [Rhodocyclales bacterium CG17_big_fil_post_rev_8_21_14_2_50_68_7]PIX74497.1 MAG: 2-alkenal reductase [Rhodocyclales bacterium CG_4_10_14_3_um_filter_68_10]HCX32864.1 2-alkenal reductase [Rhodocyclaceae bacterium]
MRRIWLVFAQTVTVALALLFVVETLRPEWLSRFAAPRAPVASVSISAAPVPAAQGVVSYRAAAARAAPSVVNIFTSTEIPAARHPFADDPLFRHFFGDGSEGPARAQSLGSGVIVGPDGYILTNNHVAEADEIEVALQDGRKFKAKVIGTDPESDLAVLRIGAGARLPAISFAQPDSLGVGDVVLAIGNPFGVGQTVTMGIVSALGRNRLGINTFENFIQTDAPINPGNSGGALVDSNGALVGINTAIYSRNAEGASVGIGFAIPVSLARSVMEQIIRTGSVTRGFLGVEAQAITPELAESFNLAGTEGALIARVVPGSPAARAGVRPGDVLVAVGGKPVRDPNGMLDLIAAIKPGETVRLKLRRDGREFETDAALTRRPTAEQQR